MNKFVLGLIVLLAAVAVFIGSWSARNNELMFNADVARDFLLYNELSEDPIMLIGPRSEYKGLFHGSAWIYANFPAYFIGQGNPVSIEWYWLFITLLFAGVNYWVARQLFDHTTGIIFAALTTTIALHRIDQFYNPNGAMFIMPLFIYCSYKYYKELDIRYMLAQLFLGGLILHFQLAAGIPLLMLTTVALLYTIVKNKKWKHFWGFFMVLVPLSPFIIFELKYGTQIQAVFGRFDGSIPSYTLSLSFAEKLKDRYEVMFGPGLGLFMSKYGHFGKYVGLFLVGMLVYIFKFAQAKKPAKDLYILALYYFIGFYVLSFVHSGKIVTHYYFPFMFIPVLIFASLHKYINWKVFAVIVIAILAINISHLQDRQAEYAARKGEHFSSWTSIHEAMSVVMDGDEAEAGLFVYAPDSYAYGPKYAALYASRESENTKIDVFEKKPVTYLFYEPFPDDQPWLNGSYWKTDLLGISSEPVETWTHKSGYKVEKYELTEEEISSPVDPLALDWVSQR